MAPAVRARYSGNERAGGSVPARSGQIRYAVRPAGTVRVDQEGWRTGSDKLMAAPLEVSPAESGAVLEPVTSGLPGKRIEGRSLGQIAWLRLRRDKVAIGSLFFIAFLILVAVVGPFLVQNPDIYHPNLINPTFEGPNGAFGGISLAHPFGVEPETGRDVLSRVVNGARYSLLIAFLATALAVAIGVFFGIVSGYFGGWVDTLIARTMDVFLAFPLLVFAIALVGVLPSNADLLGVNLTGNGLRVVMLIFIIGFFSWPYMGRIVRGQTLSLREREFVDAARSIGARGPYILFRELLPNLVGPILVYSTLLIPTNILFEAALSYLGVGIIPPTPSWGQMLSDAVTNGYYYIDPMYMVIPGMAIFLTVMAFNLFGDGLRDALDPKTR
jgi:peptide/nickel transport system permease protein/oligopeptide transport system permease protein